MISQNTRLLIHDHHHNKNAAKQILLKVEDEIYRNTYTYESLSVEPIKRGLKTSYRIACIPFIGYNFNKGDIVAAKGDVISRKIIDDGQYGYRIAYPKFPDNDTAHTAIATILKHINSAGFETEEFNDKISAVNAVNSHSAVELENLLGRLIQKGDIIAFDTIRQ
jgi:hypothetical protein